MKKKINVLIVGAGKIGAFFDNPHTAAVLTHAHAFKSMPNFNLVGFVDCNKQAAEEAAYIWDAQAFDGLAGAFADEPIDIVSVAVPDEYHFDMLKQLAQYPVKLVFAEKPLTKKLSEAQEIIALYKQKNISLLVNYTRRFVLEFREFKNRINMGLLGDYVTGTGYYGKGILHNGSHLIDFLHYLLGDIKQHEVVSFCYDFYVDDPSISAILFFESKQPFFLQAVDCRLYTIFEIDLFFTKARVRITDSGFYMQEYSLKKNALFKGYINLSEEIRVKTTLGKALLFAVQNAYNHVTDVEALLCTGYDAYRAQLVCDSLFTKVRAT